MQSSSVSKLKSHKALKKIPNYSKNVTKSFMYAGGEFFKENMSTTDSFIKNNIDIGKNIMYGLTHFKQTYKKIKKDLDNTKTISSINIIRKNAISDLKSGNIYNNQRKNQMELESSGWGDISNSDDFFKDDFSDMESMEDSTDDIVKSSTDILSNTITSATRTSINAISASSNNIIASNANMTKSLIENSNDNLSKMMITQSNMYGDMKNTVTNIGDITSKITMSLQNTNDYYNKSMEITENIFNTISEISANIKEFTEIQRNTYTMTNNEQSSEDFSPFDDGSFSINKYLGKIKKGMSEEFNNMTGGMGSLMGGDDGNLLLSFFGGSPVSFVASKSFEKLLGDGIKKSMNSFDKNFKYFMENGFSKFNTFLKQKQNDLGLGSVLTNIFGIESGTKVFTDTSAYNKEAIPFDGITKKSITDVIPTYLRKILASITNQKEMIYNYNNGSFNTLDEIKKKHKEDDSDSYTDSFYKNNNNILNSIQQSLDLSDKMMETYSNTLLKLEQGFVDSGNFFNPKKLKTNQDLLDNDIYDINANDDTYKLLINTIEGFGSEFWNEFNSNIRKASKGRDSFIKDLNDNMTENGVSALYNNSDAVKLTNVDKYEVSTNSYIRDIYKLLIHGINVFPNSSSNISSSEDNNGYFNKLSDKLKEQENDYIDKVYQKSEIDKKYNSDSIYRLMKENSNMSKDELYHFQQTSINDFISKTFGDKYRTKAKDYQDIGEKEYEKAIGKDTKKSFMTRLNESLMTLLKTPREIGKSFLDNMSISMNNFLYGDDEKREPLLTVLSNKIKDFGDKIINKLNEKIINPLNNFIEKHKIKEKIQNFFDKGKDKIIQFKDKIINGKSENIAKFSEKMFGDKFDKMSTKDFYNNYIKNNTKGLKLGAGIGAAASLFTPFGLVGGTLLGGTLGTISSSEAFKNTMFGKIGDDGTRQGGFISKSAIDKFKSIMPSIGKGAGIGAAASLFTPFGLVGGTLLGGTTSFALHLDSVQEFLFGKKDQYGNIDDSKALFKKEWVEAFKDNSKKYKIGAGVGALSGLFLPYGPIGGAVLGFSTAMLGTNEKVHKFLFGDYNPDTNKGETGLFPKLKLWVQAEILNPLKSYTQYMIGKGKNWFTENMVNPFLESIDPIKKQFVLMGRMFKEQVKAGWQSTKDFVGGMFEKHVGKPFGQVIEDKFIKPMKKVFNKVFGTITKVIGNVIKSPVTLLHKSAMNMMKDQRRNGEADYYDKWKEKKRIRDIKLKEKKLKLEKEYEAKKKRNEEISKLLKNGKYDLKSADTQKAQLLLSMGLDIKDSSKSIKDEIFKSNGFLDNISKTINNIFSKLSVFKSEEEKFKSKSAKLDAQTHKIKNNTKDLSDITDNDHVKGTEKVIKNMSNDIGKMFDKSRDLVDKNSSNINNNIGKTNSTLTDIKNKINDFFNNLSKNAKDKYHKIKADINSKIKDNNINDKKFKIPNNVNKINIPVDKLNNLKHKIPNINNINSDIFNDKKFKIPNNVNKINIPVDKLNNLKHKIPNINNKDENINSSFKNNKDNINTHAPKYTKNKHSLTYDDSLSTTNKYLSKIYNNVDGQIKNVGYNTSYIKRLLVRQWGKLKGEDIKDEAIHRIRSFFDKPKEFIKNIFGKQFGKVGKVFRTAIGLPKIIKSHFIKIGNGLFNIVSSATKGIFNLLKGIPSLIASTLRVAESLITGTVKVVSQGVVSATKILGNGLASATKILGNGLASATKILGNGLAATTKVVGNLMNTATKMLGSTLTSIYKGVLSGVELIGKGVVGTLKGVFSGAKWLFDKATGHSNINKSIRVKNIDKIRLVEKVNNIKQIDIIKDPIFKKTYDKIDSIFNVIKNKSPLDIKDNISLSDKIKLKTDNISNKITSKLSQKPKSTSIKSINTIDSKSLSVLGHPENNYNNKREESSSFMNYFKNKYNKLKEKRSKKLNSAIFSMNDSLTSMHKGYKSVFSKNGFLMKTLLLLYNGFKWVKDWIKNKAEDKIKSILGNVFSDSVSKILPNLVNGGGSSPTTVVKEIVSNKTKQLAEKTITRGVEKKVSNKVVLNSTRKLLENNIDKRIASNITNNGVKQLVGKTVEKKSVGKVGNLLTKIFNSGVMKKICGTKLSKVLKPLCEFLTKHLPGTKAFAMKLATKWGMITASGAMTSMIAPAIIYGSSLLMGISETNNIFKLSPNCKPTMSMRLVAGFTKILDDNVTFGFIPKNMLATYIGKYIFDDKDMCVINEGTNQLRTEYQMDASSGDTKATNLDEYNEEKNKSLWGKTKDAWNNTKTGVSNLWNNTKKGASNLWNNTKTGVSNLWNNTKKGASNLWDNVKGGASDIWENTKQTASDVITNVGNKFNDIKKQAVDGAIYTDSFLGSVFGLTDDDGKPLALTAWASHKTTKIIDGIKDKTNKILDGASSLWEKTKSSISDAKDSVVDGIKNMDASIGAYLGLTDDNGNSIGLKDWTVNKFTAIKDNIYNKFNGTVDGASSLWDKTKNALNNAKDSVVDGIKNMDSSVGAYLGLKDDNGNDIGLSGWVASRPSKYYKDISSTINDVKSYASELWGKIKDKMKDLKDNIDKGLQKFDNGVGNLLGFKDESGNSQSFTDGIKQVWTNVTSGIEPRKETSLFNGGRGGKQKRNHGYINNKIRGGFGTNSNQFSQNDPRWADISYGQSGTLSTEGCGPLAAASALSTVTGQNISPIDTMQFAINNGYRNYDVGTTWDYFNNIGNQYGVNMQQTNDYDHSVKDALRNGKPVILSGQGGKPYTNTGHYIVAKGLDKSGNVLINDPESNDALNKYSFNDVFNNTQSAWVTDNSNQNNNIPMPDTLFGFGPGGNDAAVATKAMNAALGVVGTPYVWGGQGQVLTRQLINSLKQSYPSNRYDVPDNFYDGKHVAVDCAGLTRYAYKQAGITIPAGTYAQLGDSRHAVNPGSPIHPGDLLYPHRGHVVMALGGNKIVHAPKTGDKVKVTDLYFKPKYIRRYLNDTTGARPNMSLVGTGTSQLQRADGNGLVSQETKPMTIAEKIASATSSIGKLVGGFVMNTMLGKSFDQSEIDNILNPGGKQPEGSNSSGGPVGDAANLGGQIDKYNNVFNTAGQKYGVDPNIMKAISMQESGGNPKSGYPNQPAWGMMQIENTLGQEYAAFGRNYAGKAFTLQDRLDPNKAIPFATYRFSSDLKHYKGDYAKAIQAYNFSKYSLDALIRNTGDRWRENRSNVGRYNGTGSSHYGDPKYIEHVVRYYKGNIAAINSLKGGRGNSNKSKFLAKRNFTKNNKNKGGFGDLTNIPKYDVFSNNIPTINNTPISSDNYNVFNNINNVNSADKTDGKLNMIIGLLQKIVYNSGAINNSIKQFNNDVNSHAKNINNKQNIQESNKNTSNNKIVEDTSTPIQVHDNNINDSGMALVYKKAKLIAQGVF